MAAADVVVTGLGVLSPIGIGCEAFWSSLLAGRSGVRRVEQLARSGMPVQIAAEIDDFDPKRFVQQRKSLKVMCRDAQLGVAACRLACDQAGIGETAVDPDRFGVVLGADRICNSLEESEPTYKACIVDGQFDFHRWGTDGMAVSFPLGFLKVLPNMIGSHISIIHDARGPNNTIHHNELSGLLAIGEAASVIQRGAADVMIAGGASSQLHPFDHIRRCVMGILSRRQDDPAAVVRPFDADRDGQVWGEGAAVLILESRRHAEARGAKVMARILGWAAAGESGRRGSRPQGTSLCRAMELALSRAGLRPDQVGHLSAHGISTVVDDEIEAQAIHRVVPEAAVTAPKSYFGNLGAAGGAVEAAACVLAVGAGLIPATLNYDRPDARCPVHVVHGESRPSTHATATLLSWTSIGQATAMVLAGPDWTAGAMV